MLLKIRVVGRCAGAMHKILGHLDHWEPYRFAKKPALLDHLVGEGEHGRRNVDA